jgi:hypothetical protein
LFRCLLKKEERTHTHTKRTDDTHTHMEKERRQYEKGLHTRKGRETTRTYREEDDNKKKRTKKRRGHTYKKESIHT